MDSLSRRIHLIRSHGWRNGRTKSREAKRRVEKLGGAWSLVAISELKFRRVEDLSNGKRIRSAFVGTNWQRGNLRLQRAYAQEGEFRGAEWLMLERDLDSGLKGGSFIFFVTIKCADMSRRVHKRILYTAETAKTQQKRLYHTISSMPLL